MALPTLRPEGSSWAKLEDSLAKDLSDYVELKIQHSLVLRKLEQREQELDGLRLELQEIYRER